MTLFTYCVRVDRGSAPNPYWGICTLAICKPKIRRVAKSDDWVVGFGSKHVGEKSYEGKVVYAMRVHESLTFQEYDELCRKELKKKIPDVFHHDIRRRLGDCMFDYSKDPKGKMRLGVHTLENRRKDLSGVNVLLSDHFFYFGRNAVELPTDLSPLIIQQQGHRSVMNDPWKYQFIEWIESSYKPNKLYGEPQTWDEMSEKRKKEKC